MRRGRARRRRRLGRHAHRRPRHPRRAHGPPLRRRTVFFALPIQDKEAYANDPAAGRLQGYDSRLATNTSGQREWEDYLFHLVQPDGLADHALWPAHPPNYVPATRDFGR